ncbi:hypothetical protein GCM10010520_15590 [Rhizobium viscosum]
MRRSAIKALPDHWATDSTKQFRFAAHSTQTQPRSHVGGSFQRLSADLGKFSPRCRSVKTAAEGIYAFVPGRL